MRCAPLVLVRHGNREPYAAADLGPWLPMRCWRAEVAGIRRVWEAQDW